jgi:hypothetical protein
MGEVNPPPYNRREMHPTLRHHPLDVRLRHVFASPAVRPMSVTT